LLARGIAIQLELTSDDRCRGSGCARRQPRVVGAVKALVIFAMACAGCEAIDRFGEFHVTSVDAAAGVDLASVPDLANTDLSMSDSAAPADLRPAFGSACGVGDGGAGIVSTAGTCLPASCSNGSVMIGFSPPPGTVGSPAPAFGSATNVFDGDVCSGWNTGTQSGTLTLMFPSPITFSRVQVANGATPTTNEPYTFYGLTGGNWIQIGSATYAVGPYGPQNPTNVTPGTYDGLQLAVGTSGSSILILEVTLAQ
jgi:hypothetical protein